jgi:hypothetical protein
MVYDSPEYLGILGLSTNEKVSKEAANISDIEKDVFQKAGDTILTSYKYLVSSGKFPPFVFGSADAPQMIEYISQQTSVPKNVVTIYLAALQNCTGRGEINVKHYNPAESKQVTKNFLLNTLGIGDILQSVEKGFYTIAGLAIVAYLAYNHLSKKGAQ